ncbi:TonB-dependent receptor [Halosquirtibacter laminarini]|uniref:TonB-dependent receptor n=1 Tax=Halosquirtibacter laminarini TaxID=3374600 RepID=A0AC61NKD2_9BACT|nr:TonB-dependent receptor [Prolixibacteraceae bacterium]
MKVNSLFKSMFFLLVALLSIGVAQAQERIMTGSVVDKTTREPLPGVTIAVEGTVRGIITDFDGNFALKVKKGEVLRISYIGYVTQKITVASQTTIAVELATDTKGLDEVVVIGYGTSKKEDLTGSVQAVSSDDFKQGSASSPQELINGKVAGVQITSSGGAPGSGTKIRVRGGSSINASNDPLIIVDGVPLDNGGVSGMRNPLNVVNPNDIETFTVLKDASATAIYGSRASNGVILITTKKGSKEGVHVDYSGKFSVGTNTKEMDLMNREQYTTLLNEKYDGQSILTKVGEYDTDWQKEIYRTSFSQDHSVSVSGTLVENLPYRLSMGYNDSNGTIKTSNMKRYTTALNLNPSFFDDHLRTTVSFKYMNVRNRFAELGAVGSAASMDPTHAVSEPGNEAFGGYYTWVDNNGDPIDIAPKNPIAQLNQKDNSSTVNRYIINGQFDYKFHFLPELRANLNVGLDKSNSDGTITTDPQAAWDLGAFNRGGAREFYTGDKKNEILDFYLQYSKDLDKIDSRIDVMGGYSWQHFWWEKTGASYYNQDTAGSVDAPESDRVRSPFFIDRSENYLVSFFARLNYSFKGRYLLTATVRRDGSSKFSKDNRIGVFPSVALAWNMKKESFLKDVDVVSQLKLRGGYGITGQQDVGTDYGYFGVYTKQQETAQYIYYKKADGTYTKVKVAGNRPEGYDANLKWEQTATSNIGVDYGFFDGRLTGSLDVYTRKTTDLLNTVPVAALANLEDQLLTNVGDMTNKGFEFSITGKVIDKKDLSWNLAANVTYNKNEITKLTSSDDPNYKGVMTGGISGGTGNTIQIMQVGQPVNSFYVYEQVYDANGAPIEGAYVDRNNDNKIDQGDMYVYKKAAPDVLLGFSTSLRYKNWDFSASARANLGGYVYNNMESNRSYYASMQTNGNYLSNLMTSYFDTQFKDAQYMSDMYVKKASFFRLDNVQIGYNFNQLFKQGSSLEDVRLRLYGSVDNVFVVSPYDGIDPEVDNGIDQNVYPRPRTFMFGVNISF